MKDKEFTAEQKEEMYARSQYEATRRYRAGKGIVTAIVVLEFLISVFALLIEFRLWEILLSAGFYYLLWKGHPRIREYYALMSVFFSLLQISSLQAGVVPTLVIVFSLPILILRIAAGLMMWFSPSVEEFLYGQHVG